MDKYHQQLLSAYKQAGGNLDVFKDIDMAHLMVHGNEVCSSRTIPGLQMQAKSTSEGVDLKFLMKSSFKYDAPLNVCFGLIPQDGIQKINLEGIVEDDAGIKILAFCIFPNAANITHLMKAKVRVGDNSYFDYQENHYHGTNGGVSLVPKLDIEVGKNSRFSSQFVLTKGRAGKVDIQYAVDVNEESSADLSAKIYGSGSDNIKINESIDLRGRGSRGLLKSRVVVGEQAISEVINKVIARKANCMGHIDCIETIMDSATASAYPSLKVYDSLARVTHEAAVGRLDSKQLNALMAKGLNKEQAIEVLIKGLLK